MKQFILEHRNTFLGLLAGFIALFIWASNNLIATEMSDHISPIEFAFCRWFIVFIVLFALTFKRIKAELPYIKKQWLLITASAFAVPVFDNLCFYQAGHTATALDISLIGSSGPLFIVLLNLIFLKKLITNLQAFGLLVALFGVIFVITNGQITDLSGLELTPGNILTLLATFAFATYTFMQCKKSEHISTEVFLCLMAGIGCLLLLPIFLYYEFSKATIFHIGLKGLGTLLYTGFCISLVAYLFWNLSIAKLGPLKTSFLGYFSPLLVAGLVYIFLGIPITWQQATGGAFIIFGCILINLKLKRALRKGVPQNVR